MTLSDAGLEFIKQQELFVSAAYQDAAGVWTIGYGHTGTNIHPGMHISQIEANNLLRGDTETARNAIDSLVKAKLNQRQFDALVSLVFNIGVGAFTRSTILKMINENPANPVIRAEFSKWVFVTRNGERVILKALQERRKQESTLYFS